MLVLIGEFLERFVQQFELVVRVGIRDALAEVVIILCLADSVGYLLVSLREIPTCRVQVPGTFKEGFKDRGGIQDVSECLPYRHRMTETLAAALRIVKIKAGPACAFYRLGIGDQSDDMPLDPLRWR